MKGGRERVSEVVNWCLRFAEAMDEEDTRNDKIEKLLEDDMEDTAETAGTDPGSDSEDEVILELWSYIMPRLDEHEDSSDFSEMLIPLR